MNSELRRISLKNMDVRLGERFYRKTDYSLGIWYYVGDVTRMRTFVLDEVPALLKDFGLIDYYEVVGGLPRMYKVNQAVRQDRITGQIIWPEATLIGWDEIEITEEFALQVARSNEFEIAQSKMGLIESVTSTIKAFTNLITAA